jgi:chromate transporter
MGFGGALANMALMEQACVKQHKWLTQAHYLERVALSYLLPDPTAVLLSIYLGSRRHGLVGGVVSGLSFIAPAVVLTFVLSWVYFQYHSIPAISRCLRDLARSSSPSSWRCSTARREPP